MAVDYTKIVSGVEQIPAFLRPANRWLTWSLSTARGGHPTKVPDQSTREAGRTFEAALNGRPWEPSPTYGLGLILTGGVELKMPSGKRWLVLLDIDACRDPGTGALVAEVVEILEHYGNPLTEVTPSGTGVRVWFGVTERPSFARVKVRGTWAAPAGVTKTPEIQIFGLGPAEYVTITGLRIAACSASPAWVNDLGWLAERWGFTYEDAEARMVMPAGDGDPPSVDAVAEQLAQTCPDLVDANWQKVMPKKSASEAYHALVCRALRAAGGWGEIAVDYLLTRTAWGRGEVHDSRDPSKYTRRSWVERDVMRAAQRTPAKTAAVFSPAPPAPALAPPPPPAPARSAQPKPWSRVSLATMLATPAPPWLVQGWVRAGQLGFLVAFPGVGKSTLAAAWAMSVLHGQPWCGRRVTGGSVLCLVGEGRRGFAHRLRAYQERHSLGEAPKGRYLEIVDLREPLSGTAGQVAAGALVDEAIAEHGHAPALIVIDTLSAHWAADEDSAEFGGPAMRALAEVAARTGAVVLVLHHTTKDNGGSTLPKLHELRGSGTFIGNTDFVLGMAADQGKQVIFGSMKLKDDEHPPMLRLTRESVHLGTDADGDAITAAVLLGDTAEEVTDAGRRATETEALDRDLRLVIWALHQLGGTKSKAAIALHAKMNATRARAVIDIGESRGYIHVTKTRPFVYTVTPEGHKWACAFATDGCPVDEALG